MRTQRKANLERSSRLPGCLEECLRYGEMLHEASRWFALEPLSISQELKGDMDV